MHTIRTRPTVRAVRRTLIAALLAGSVAIPLFSGAALAQENGGNIDIGDLGSVPNENTVTASEGGNGGEIGLGDLEPAADMGPVTNEGDALPANHDADWDGLPADLERAHGLHPFVTDTDRDGLTDGAEFDHVFGNTDPLVFDTDGDRLGDGQEVVFTDTFPSLYDSDGDELGDGQEFFDYGTDPSLYDTDGDGYSDGEEVGMGRDPLVPGT